MHAAKAWAPLTRRRPGSVVRGPGLRARCSRSESKPRTQDAGRRTAPRRRRGRPSPPPPPLLNSAPILQPLREALVDAAQPDSPIRIKDGWLQCTACDAAIKANTDGSHTCDCRRWSRSAFEVEMRRLRRRPEAGGRGPGASATRSVAQSRVPSPESRGSGSKGPGPQINRPTDS